MRQLTFKVDGRPVQWKRPGQGEGGHRYTVSKVRDFAELIKWAVIANARQQGFKLDAPSGCRVEVLGTSTYKMKRGDESLDMLDAPDIDNLQKVVFDAMNKLVYDDDRQITLVVWQKIRGEVEGTSVTVKVYD